MLPLAVRRASCGPWQKRRDVIDAALALLVEDGDHIVTSDPEDTEPLVVALRPRAELIPA